MHDFLRFTVCFTITRKIKKRSPCVDTNTRYATKIEIDQKEVVFMWAPGHVGIRGNGAVDRASKEALEKEPVDVLMPFSDLKPLTAKCIHQVWQKK